MIREGHGSQHDRREFQSADMVAANPDTDGGATVHVARFGSFALVSDEPLPTPHADTLDAVVRSLEEDSRVARVQPPELLEEEWCYNPRLYPAGADPTSIIAGDDVLHGLRFSDPLAFDVNVPEKNQRRMREGDPIPTRYHVIWDGVLVVVAWSRRDAGPTPKSGGHVVTEVLTDALSRAGLRLYVQACSPGCTNNFAHTTVRLVDAGDSPSVEYANGQWLAEIVAMVPESSDEARAARLFSNLTWTAFTFTRLKNLGRRILDIERDARETLARLMTLNHHRAQLPLLGPRARVAARWSLRGWRRESRRLIARQWLTLSTIEMLQREWAAERFSFESEVEELGCRGLFALDYADEVLRVQSLNPDLMRAGVQEAADRLDSRALILVTTVAGVAGAVAGGIVVLVGG